MEFEEVVRRRRMVRRYDSERPVPAELRDRLLDAGRRTPSAGFTQGVSFLVLESVAEREQYWRCVSPDGPPDTWLRDIRTAPLLVLMWTSAAAYRRRYAEPDKSGRARDELEHDRTPVVAEPPAPWWFVDAGMAAQALLYAAVDVGLAAAFVGVPAGRVTALRSSFGVPEEQSLVGLLTVGYRAAEETPSGSPRRRPRRGLDDQVRRGRW